MARVGVRARVEVRVGVRARGRVSTPAPTPNHEPEPEPDPNQVRVRLDLSAPSRRGELSFAVNGGEAVVAVRQLYARCTPGPIYFYPSVHLTDISVPRDGDLPLKARVSMSAGP